MSSILHVAPFWLPLFCAKMPKCGDFLGGVHMRKSIAKSALGSLDRYLSNQWISRCMIYEICRVYYRLYSIFIKYILCYIIYIYIIEIDMHTYPCAPGRFKCYIALQSPVTFRCSRSEVMSRWISCAWRWLLFWEAEQSGRRWGVNGLNGDISTNHRICYINGA